MNCLSLRILGTVTGSHDEYIHEKEKQIRWINLSLLFVFTLTSLSQQHLYLPLFSFYLSQLALLGQQTAVSPSLFLTRFWVGGVPVAGIPLQVDLLQCEYGDVCQTLKTNPSAQHRSDHSGGECFSDEPGSDPRCDLLEFPAEVARSALVCCHVITHSLAARARVAPGSWSRLVSSLHQQRLSFLTRTGIGEKERGQRSAPVHPDGPNRTFKHVPFTDTHF